MAKTPVIATPASSSAGVQAATTGGVHPRDVIRKGLTWVTVFAVLVILGFGIEHELQKRSSSGSKTAATKVICQDASAKETRGCIGLVSNKEWTEKFKAADGQDANGMMLCRTPGVEYEQTQEAGTTWWRFMAIGSPTTVQYRFFSRDEPCPSKLP